MFGCFLLLFSYTFNYLILYILKIFVSVLLGTSRSILSSLHLLDRLILLGNHRDSWAFGASDPGSGTATMLEVARALGWLKKKGNVAVFLSKDSMTLNY